MGLSRLLVLALALGVSPLGAAVCEIACGSPADVTAQAAPASPGPGAVQGHHHHHQTESQAQELTTEPAPGMSRVQAPASAECDPVTAAPARIRAVFSEIQALSHLHTVVVVPSNASGPVAHPAVISSSPPPRSPAPVPLRI